METIRQFVRSLIPYNSLLYRFAARVTDFVSIISQEGLGSAIELMRLDKASSTTETTVEIQFKSLAYPLSVRAGTEDVGTIINNIIRQEYGQYDPGLEPNWIVDAGAYIGDTSVYYLSRHPNARVIALEPDPENLEIAKRNLAPYGDRCMVSQRGLWGADETIHISGDFTNATITREGVSIEGISVASLLNEYGIEYLDILKMDIEGAEAMVFSEGTASWLDRVGCLIIEFHGAAMKQNISELLTAHGFQNKKFRSLNYFTR